MSIATVEEFLLLFEDFTTQDVNKVQALLDYVERVYCPYKSWGSKQKDGIMLMTAHLGYMRWFQSAELAAAGSAIASGGQLKSLSPSEQDLQLTTYGRQYLNIRKTLPRITGFGI